MTWVKNDAASRQMRTFISNYARALERNPGDSWLGSLPRFCGMNAEEFGRWADTGEVSDRWVRVCAHGWRVEFDLPSVVLYSIDRPKERLTAIALGITWREALMMQVRRRWPGAADAVQAYIETEIRR